MVDRVMEAVRSLVNEENVILDKGTSLIGDGRVLDSLALVELCLKLEDVATELGFEFDWTSDAAMSRGRSMFRDIGTLAEEFARQEREQS